MTSAGRHGPAYARPVTDPTPWAAAREAAYAAGVAGRPAPLRVPLASADSTTLAGPLATLTDLPAFPTSSVDGWAGRGPQPWRVVGRALAGSAPAPLTADGTCVEIATGAMVPAGTERIVRTEDSTVDGERVSGEPRPVRDWRDAGEEAHRGEELLAAGTPVTPAVIGLAAACGYDDLAVRPAPTVGVVVFGDELATAGLPGHGRVREALGVQLPGWLRRLGAAPGPVLGPVADTLDEHVRALKQALDGADVVCSTGGTMHGPVDHLHPALAKLGGEYIVDTVAVRPGVPMLLARFPGGKFLAGLPGNPQSAVVGLATLVVPLLAGLAGRPVPAGRCRLGAEVPGRGDYTHLALVRVEDDGLAYPLPHAGSAMLRGVARADGFAVIPPGGHGAPGTEVDLLPLPLLPGERP